MQTLPNHRHLRHELPAVRSTSRSTHLAQLGPVYAVHE
jgi:hypothetical protein